VHCINKLEKVRSCVKSFFFERNYRATQFISVVIRTKLTAKYEYKIPVFRKECMSIPKGWPGRRGNWPVASLYFAIGRVKGEGEGK
jgi:hypothetical protein